MIDVRTGEKVIDYLTDERRLAERNPEVADTLNALKVTQNAAEELLYQGSMHHLFRDAWKIGTPLAELPMEVFLAISNLHPEWFVTGEGVKEFKKWLIRHPGYGYRPKFKHRTN
jgi:hypothetical protein